MSDGMDSVKTRAVYCFEIKLVSHQCSSKDGSIVSNVVPVMFCILDRLTNKNFSNKKLANLEVSQLNFLCEYQGSLFDLVLRVFLGRANLVRGSNP